MKAPVWLTKRVILAIHDDQLTQHGGASGLRDLALLESALARPENHALYGEPDLAELAALSAIAIVRNHPFVDGNKRTAYVALELFLANNGFDFVVSDADAVVMTLQMASGELADEAIIAWVRTWTRPRG